MRKRSKHKGKFSAHKARMGAFVFIATITTALISFISFELAVFAFGLFSCAGLFMLDARRRNFWERSAEFKLKTLHTEQDAQRKNILHHEQQINALKSDMRRIRESGIMQDAQPHAGAEPAKERDTDDAAPPFSFLQALTKIEPYIKAEPARPARVLRAVRPQDASADKGADASEADQFSTTLVQELLRHALEHKRVDVFVQPIVRLPQRQARFYEVFARIRARPGQYLPAARYQPVAEQDNLMPDIDSLLLLHCLKTIQESAHIEKAAPFFLNITGKTLKDLGFMKRLLGFLSQHKTLARRIVLEIPQAEFLTLPPALLEVMRGLGRLGCTFSLDHVTALEFDIPQMQALKIRYIKLHHTHLQKALRASQGYKVLQKTKRQLEANGIGVIIEKIETEDELRALLDYDLQYGQGYLFGKPDLQGAYASRARAKRSDAASDTERRA